MAVNPKERKMLNEMWGNAKEAAGNDLPDGTYQFEIVAARFHMSDKGKPQFKTKIKVVGGEDEYKGKELEVNDNLETVENQGWFKRKLRRLNIAIPEDMDDIIDGAVADEMEGLIFEGQVKTKNDFMNVYVNRLIGEGSAGRKEKDAEDADEPEEKEEEKETSAAFEEGDEVKWGEGDDEHGTIVEVLEDEGKARIQTEDDEIVRKPLAKLSKTESDGDKEEESEDSEEFDLPSAEDVEGMKAKEVHAALEAIGFEDIDDMKAPREVLHGFCTLAEDEDAKIELTEIKPLAAALGVKFGEGDSVKEKLKKISKAVQKRLN